MLLHQQLTEHSAGRCAVNERYTFVVDLSRHEVKCRMQLQLLHTHCDSAEPQHMRHVAAMHDACLPIEVDPADCRTTVFIELVISQSL